MPNRGHLIAVEGLEGAGKSTALHTIKCFLTERVPSLITTREPGGTRVGEVIRKLIKEPSSELLDSRAELLLLYAARIQLVEQVIRPALREGNWVLADRFELSTFAYQGGGRKLSQDSIAQLSSFCLNDFKPDLILFLDISPETGLQRARKRGKSDRIEQEALSFFKDVYDCYHQCIKDMDNVVVIDASQPLDDVQQDICTKLNHYMSNYVDPVSS